MSIKEDIKMLLAKKAITMTKLAELMSENGQKSTVKTLSNKLARKTIKFEEVRTILDILGFDIEYKERV